MMKRIRVPHHYAREARGGLVTHGVTLAENASGKKRHAAVVASPDQGELSTSQVQSTSPRLLRFTVVNTNPFISTSDRTTTSYTCGARLAARRTRRGIRQRDKTGSRCSSGEPTGGVLCSGACEPGQSSTTATTKRSSGKRAPGRGGWANAHTAESIAGPRDKPEGKSQKSNANLERRSISGSNWFGGHARRSRSREPVCQRSSVKLGCKTTGST